MKAGGDTPVVSIVAEAGRGSGGAPSAAQAAALLSASAEQVKDTQKSKRDAQVHPPVALCRELEGSVCMLPSVGLLSLS
jgi:hypothetical protein